ncbi:DUF2726 domain-containing protein [Ottowia sp.]|uniref:DUF2726 domain-containing protein n=1 Tax=Ottowia sp. TaxID=1898956 RepID=UPI003A84E533
MASNLKNRLRHPPAQWPLNPRPLANRAERQVWAWLRQVFPEHQIMIKLPVTRFTMPREQGVASEWFEVLSSAYCTYTVSNTKGRVMGCLDLVGPHGLSRDNQHLKQTLLAQCGIGYLVLTADALPSAEQLRADFLGVEFADTAATATEPARLEEVRRQLHEVLDRNRSFRHQRLSGAGTGAGDLPGDYPTPWPQPDSFLTPLDSRRAPLEEHPPQPQVAHLAATRHR